MTGARRRKSFAWLFAIIMVMGMFGWAVVPRADAILTLTLDDTAFGGSPDVSLTDNAIGDLNPLIGAITFSGPVGAFTVNVTTALSKPILGSATVAEMDLNDVSVASSGGTLVIKTSDDGFVLGPGSLTLISDVGGTLTAGLGSSDAFQQCVSLTNTQFDCSGISVLQGPFGPGAFAGSASTSFAYAGGPFAITEVATLTLTGAGSTSFDFSSRVVPQPAALLLLGAGLLAVGAAPSWLRSRQGKGRR